jgi:8-oxo-dGTP diphosphatase
MTSKTIVKYVAGFVFDDDEQRVILIRKLKPAWQKGLLNGVGGKIEGEEKPHNAMAREFEEETGVKTMPLQWRHYATWHHDKNGVDVFFFSMTNGAAFKSARTVEEEKVERIPVRGIHLRPQMIANLRWLIPLALDKQCQLATVRNGDWRE